MSRRILTSLARNWLRAIIEPRRILGIYYLPRYVSHWRLFGQLNGSGSIHWRESYPCLTDWFSHTPFDPHYFYQAFWAARKLAQSPPTRHVDVGSSVMFISVISAWVPTLFIDYRPLKASIPALSPIGGDLLALPFANGAVGSLSCLHVIEHVGLGRYGDPLDPQGSIKAAQELRRVLSPGGRLLLSTPIGRERIQFNAHRVFAPTTVRRMFKDLHLTDFSFVDDNGWYHPHAKSGEATELEYGCGMFEFVRPST